MGGRQSTQRSRERSQIVADLQAAKERNETLQKQVDKYQNKHDDLEQDIKKLRENDEHARQQRDDEKQAKVRWTNFAVDLQKRYNAQSRLVQELVKKNQYLQKQLDQERHLSLLERVQLAIDTDPMFEDEIRNILNDSPAIQKDFQRLFLVDADGPGSVESQPGPSSRTESDGCRRIESDSVRTESDGFTQNDEGYETPDEDAVQSGVAIAYVLSKMHNKN